MHAFLQDVRYGLRMLWRSPGFTTVALLTLAVAIGANTLIFSFMEQWVIRPLPWPQPERLIDIAETDTNKGWEDAAAPANLLDWKQQNRVFEQIAGYINWDFNLTASGEPERLAAAKVDAGFFGLLGAGPRMGRDFLPKEGEPGSDHVAILSHALWQSRFGSDAAVIGKAIKLDGEDYSVVGVLPADFHVPSIGRIQLWVPLALTLEQRARRDRHWLGVLAKLKPGVTLDQARAEMNGIAQRLERAWPDTNRHRGVRLITLHERVGRDAGNNVVVTLFVSVLCVLMIGCANVANLLLARATAREREIAVRLAVGAGRWRLVRQLLTENLLLFLAAAGLGVLLAAWGLDWLTAGIPYKNRGYLRNFGHVTLDSTALVFTLGISILTSLVFGLAPALQSARLDLQTSLREAGGTSGTGRGRRLRNVLAASEIALALVLLVAAGLAARSVARFYRLNLGFQPDHVMVAELDLPISRYAEGAHLANFTDDLLRRVRGLPGVAGAAAAQNVPFISGGRTEFAIEGRLAPEPGQVPVARLNASTPDYLAAMRIPLVRGRQFADADAAGALPVAMINQTLARRYWTEGQNPVGQRIRVGSKGPVVRTIVGVVQDVVYRVGDVPNPQIYVPFAQSPARSFALVVRSGASAAGLAPAIRSAVWAVDKEEPITLQALEQVIQDQHYPYRITTKLMSFFGGAALFLAAIGIYGVMAYAVSHRIREIGIRMALGAQRSHVLALVVRQGTMLIACGLAVGLLGALAAARAMATLPLEIVPEDPWTFGAVTALMGGLALLACYIPARRAAGTDPMEALRYE